MFTKYRILIYSENPDTLMTFYTDVLQLKLIKKLSYADDYGYMLEVHKDYLLWIGKHSKVTGKSKDMFRHINNLYPTEGVTYWYNKIKDHPKVTIVAKPFLAPFSTATERTFFCTFLDPEGNCWQFVGEE